MTLEQVEQEFARHNYYFDRFYDFYKIQQSTDPPLQYNLCWSNPETKCLNVWSVDGTWFKQVFLKNMDSYIYEIGH